MMVDLGGQRGGPLRIIDAPTSVDCAREVRFRRSFRSLVECMVPCCGFFPTPPPSHADNTTTTVTGTFFGHRKGRRVSFCLQDDSRSSPFLLLELGVPTAYLAKEMQHGSLRIALECDATSHQKARSPSLYGVAAWSMYCNGRKLGYAVRRRPSEGDSAMLRGMRSVTMGAGVLPPPGFSAACDELEGDMVMYLRASFERVVGSKDSEAFHIINPVGSSAQELSIFLLRTS